MLMAHSLGTQRLKKIANNKKIAQNTRQGCKISDTTFLVKVWVVLPQLSSTFFRLFFGLFVTENAVIDVTVQEMINNIATLHTFQIKKKLSKSMQPILKYSKSNMWFL
jgi:hypothetical protein